MSKYLKKFQQHSDYESFVERAERETPFVSVCVNEGDCHYDYLMDPYPNVLTFMAKEPNSSIKFRRVGTGKTLSNAVLQYSTNYGKTWNNYLLNANILLNNDGDSVKFKGINSTLAIDINNHHQFVMTGKISAKGDITSLFNGDGLDVVMPSYACFKLFSGCTSLITAPKLPSTTLGNNCYYLMFSRCSELTESPELPATTLASNCYESMFSNCTSLTTGPSSIGNSATTMAASACSRMFYECTSLTTAPELPATTLASYCYYSMFGHCSSLVVAPELPATTLAKKCYYAMFTNCLSLAVAPELPATTLVDGCYSFIFNICSNINYIKAMFTTTPSTNYTNSWVSGVSSTGIFVKNSSASWDVSGNHGIPTNWTVQTASS